VSCTSGLYTQRRHAYVLDADKKTTDVGRRGFSLDACIQLQSQGLVAAEVDDSLLHHRDFPSGGLSPMIKAASCWFGLTMCNEAGLN